VVLPADFQDTTLLATAPLADLQDTPLTLPIATTMDVSMPAISQVRVTPQEVSVTRLEVSATHLASATLPTLPTVTTTDVLMLVI
jgi:hypothetical protein